ncbi:hypothetical protein LZ30DRAFT_728217 [Colletotrichum cereale]|nr:hypothetical protein LZ30DRAFT_728217 [Colletotrichum cereale]
MSSYFDDAVPVAPRYYYSDSKMSKKEREEQEARLRYLHREIQRYRPRQMLMLYPREPGAPHGLPSLGLLPEGQLPSGRIRNFDPETEVASEEVAQVQVLEVLSGGIDCGAQVLLCMVVKAPTHAQREDIPGSYKPFDAGLKVVLKVYDPIFFPDPDDRDWIQREISNDNRVDGQLSREANALQRLYGKGLTGHPHLNPQYHGSWAMKFNVGDSSEVQWRCAGAVLIEYIEGASMESMCDRDENNHLDPETAFLRSPGSGYGTPGLSFSEVSARLKVFRTLLDGCVSWLHAGVDHTTFLEPCDIFITLGNNGVDLEEPRVVFLDYSFCVAYSDNKASKTGRADEVDRKYPAVPSKYLLNVHPLERLPRPPHPAWKFDVDNLDQFAGWFPSEWLDCPADFENWLVGEFGEIVEGRYSTYETLKEVMSLAVANAKALYAKDLGIDLSDVSDTATGEPGDLDLGGVYVKPDPGLLQFPEREQERLESEARYRELRELVAKQRKYFEELGQKPQAKDGDKKLATLARGTLSKFTGLFKRGDDTEGKGEDTEVVQVPEMWRLRGVNERSAAATGGQGSGRAPKTR